MVDDTRRFLTTALCGASGLIAAICLAAPASAEPAVPAPPPAPVVGPAVPAPGPAAAPVQAAAAPIPGPAAPAPADPLVPPAPGAPAPGAGDAAALAGPAPAEGKPHLASPDALPPGSTMDPATQDREGPNTSYLRDLWQAVQSNEISGKEALIMGLAQRGMNTPYPTQAAGPNVPLTPANSPQLAAPPAPGAPVPPPAPVAPVPPPAPLPTP